MLKRWRSRAVTATVSPHLCRDCRELYVSGCEVQPLLLPSAAYRAVPGFRRTMIPSENNHVDAPPRKACRDASLPLQAWHGLPTRYE